MIQHRILRLFAIIDRPAAWVLLVGGFVTFLAVVFNLVATGTAKWATLLIAADLTVSGFSAVQQSESDERVLDSATIERIKVLDVGPEDTIIFFAPGSSLGYDDETWEEIRAEIREITGCRDVIVVNSPDTDVSVLRHQPTTVVGVPGSPERT